MKKYLSMVKSTIFGCSWIDNMYICAVGSQSWDRQVLKALERRRRGETEMLFFLSWSPWAKPSTHCTSALSHHMSRLSSIESHEKFGRIRLILFIVMMLSYWYDVITPIWYGPILKCRLHNFLNFWPPPPCLHSGRIHGTKITLHVPPLLCLHLGDRLPPPMAPMIKLLLIPKAVIQDWDHDRWFSQFIEMG